MRRTTSSILYAALIFAIASCGGTGGTEPSAPTVATVDISPSSASLIIGQSTQLSASTRDATGLVLSGHSLTWASANSAIATISNSGLLTGVAVGTTSISVTSEGHAATASVTVLAAPVAAVVVTPATASVQLGQTLQLAASTNDANGNVLSGRAVTWSSSNTAVATVSATGLVSSVSLGSASITATSEGKFASSQLSVVPVPVANVVVSPVTGTIQVGQTLQLAATATDANNTALPGRTIAWTSSNATVATVSNTGLVSAASAGSVSITATCEGKSASSQVSVTVAPVATVSVTPPATNVQTGQTVQLTALLADAAGTALSGRSVTWTSSNSAIATVSSAGLVSGVAAGAVTISATSENKTGTSQITVTPTPVASVTLSPTTLLLAPGQTGQLTATLRDGGGNLLSGRTVTWTTSSSGIATVSASGLVSAVTSGTANITASSEGITAQATVTIPPATTVIVTNSLIDDIVVSANGTAIGTVSAGQTQQRTIYVTALSLTYDLVRPTTSGGTPIGESMAGIFQTISNPVGNITFVVNNQLGSQYYFAPLITNNSAYPLLMVANWGLVSENRCNCSVPAFATSVNIGYYKLYSNSDVRGYSPNNGYGSGTYVYWNTFPSIVTLGSGAVPLTNTSSVFDRIGNGDVGLFTPTAASPQRTQSPVSGPVYDHAMPRK